jgi:hypothetical protein
MKTNELTGAALDWAVAEIENPKPEFYRDNEGLEWEREYTPSTNWAQGGPIIEREKIDLQCWDAHSMPWKASMDGDTDAGIALYVEYGPSPLIAAMRCYVASKLGDDIEIPKELL